MIILFLILHKIHMYVFLTTMTDSSHGLAFLPCVYCPPPPHYKEEEERI